jgi:hypothetical protein
MTAKSRFWSLLCAAFLLTGCAGKAGVPPQTAAEREGEREPAWQYPQAGYAAPTESPPARESPFGEGRVSPSAPERAPAASAPSPLRSPSPQSAPTGGSAPAKKAEAHAQSAQPSTETKTAARKDDRPREERESARAAESRPGLGTEWGENRVSRVHDVTFVRDSGRPFAVATLHYNDRKGVDAMANLHAARDTQRNVSTAGGAVTIAIKDATGSPLEAVHVGDRTMVVGQAGQRYSIVLTNHTDHRFESVVTVDGLDVVNGKTGSAENRGYVLLPFTTLEIEGFRQSAAAVAAFRFAAVSESYAAQTGQARNVGVIGVALFSERGDTFVNAQELRLRDTANPFPADPRFAQPPRR